MIVLSAKSQLAKHPRPPYSVDFTEKYGEIESFCRFIKDKKIEIWEWLTVDIRKENDKFIIDERKKNRLIYRLHQYETHGLIVPFNCWSIGGHDAEDLAAASPNIGLKY